MGRIFAGILGPMAFLVIILRGLIHGASVEATLETACLALVIFSALGGWFGSIADATVEHSVQTTFETTLSAVESAQSGPPQPPTH